MSRSSLLIDPAKLRRLRQEKGWSQLELASAAGLARKTVEDLERDPPATNGVAPAPRHRHPHTLRCVAEALQVDPRELLLSDEVSPPPAQTESGVTLQLSAGKMLVTVRLDIPFEVWMQSKDAQELLLKAMMNVAQVGDLLQPKAQWPGSTWLALELTPEQAERLFLAISRGELRHLGIVEMEPLSPLPRIDAARALTQLVREALELYQQGNNMAALGKADRAQEAVRQLQPLPAWPDLATALNNLAALWLTEQRLALAEELLLAVLALEGHGADTARRSFALSLHNLAVLHERQGLLVEADREYRRALELLELAGLREGNEALAVLSNLGSLCAALGRLEEAASFLNQALALRRQTQSADRRGQVVGMRKLAYVLARQGRLTEADALQRQAATIAKATGTKRTRDVPAASSLLPSHQPGG